jgi:antibiotic biosynthesis monooxygenase (ABM) superfamily enzyme
MLVAHWYSGQLVRPIGRGPLPDPLRSVRTAIATEHGGSDVIERHITFTVHPDSTASFERFIADEYAPAMAQSPGFVRIELLREAGSATRYQLSFRFRDGESAAGWRTSPVHMSLQPALEALHSGMQVQGYDVVG